MADDMIAYVGSADIRERAFFTNCELGFVRTGYPARVVSSILSLLVDSSDRIR